MNLYLVAKSGDCSKDGMGNYNDAVLVERKHYDLVKRFLRAQFDFEMEGLVGQSEGKWLIDDEDVVVRYINLTEELLDANVFKHKYHCRTYWAWVLEDKLKDHQPVAIDDVVVEFNSDRTTS